MSKNLIARLSVAIIFIPAILWFSYQGGWWLYGFVMFLATVAMTEFLIAEGYSLKKPAFWLLLGATVFLVDAATGILSDCLMKNVVFATPSGKRFVAGAAFRYWQYIMIVPFLLVISMLFSIGKDSPANLFNRMTRLVWGVLYIGLLYPFVYKLGLFVSKSPFGVLPTRGGEIIPISQIPVNGGDVLLFLFAILWIGDTAAMYVGKSMGKNKLAPSVSPNKTVEGFLGGLIAAIIVGIVMGCWKFNEFPLYQITFVAFLCSLFGQLGDLVESMWKRSLGIKDSSAIIPGHGGFLDRFDSLLFAAPVMYYYFIIFR